MKTCPRCGSNHNKTGQYCSRSCANVRVRTAEVKEKISETLKKRYSEVDHPCKGRPGWKHSEADKELKRLRTIEFWDKRGRIERTEKEIRAARVSGVQAYRARKYSATPSNANRNLIKKIYENCPAGYEVDHVVALCDGGQHHEDNLQYLPAMENRRKNKTEKYDKSLAIKWQDIL